MINSFVDQTLNITFGLQKYGNFQTVSYYKSMCMSIAPLHALLSENILLGKKILYTEQRCNFRTKGVKGRHFFTLQNQVDDGSKLRSLRQKCSYYALTD